MATIPYSTNTRLVRLSGKQNRLKVMQQLRKLPKVLAGKELTNSQLSRNFKTAIGVELLTKIHDAYLVKSTGTSDELGNRWKPLAKSTIAARPIRPGEKSSLGIPRKYKDQKGLLSPSEKRQWGGIFRSLLAKFLLQGMGNIEAHVKAAKLAWAIMKSRGAKTRIDTLGNRNVPILRVTDRLLNSITPGRYVASSGVYSPPTEQIFTIRSDSVTIGSKVPYAKYVHRKRPLWPVGNARWNGGMGAVYGQRAGISTWLQQIVKNLTRQLIQWEVIR